MGKNKKQMDLLNGPLGINILKFALPLAVTGILQQLFNAADVAVIGRFAGTNAMAAVGSNSPVIGLLVNMFVGLSVGANVVIAKYIGQQNRKGASDAAHTAVMMALISGVFLTVVGEIMARPMLELLGVPGEVLELAVLYLRIYFIGMPVILLYNFEAAIFRSVGDTRTPLICLTISGTVNVVLNLIFVIGMGRSVDGVAAATVISNVVSSGLLFFFLLRSRSVVRLELHRLRINRGILAQILRIGMPAGLQSAVFSISNLLIQSAVNSLGADVMAASSAAFNLEIFAYYVLNSFGQACTTFVGQNYGAGNPERCRKATKIAMLQDMVLTVVMSAVIIAAGRPLLHLFIKDPAIVEVGLIRIKYIVTLEIINAAIEVLSGSMRGYGYSLVPALMAFIGICGTRIVWVFTIFRRDPGFDTLMLVYPVSWTITVAALIIAYMYVRKHAAARLMPAAE